VVGGREVGASDEALLALALALIPRVEGIMGEAQLILDELRLFAEPPITRPPYEQHGGWSVGEAHRRMRQVEYLVVHHEGGPDSPEGSSALAINRWQRGTLGYAGIGYHIIIERDGRIHEGRPLWAVGAHAMGFNSNSWGVCLIGNLSLTSPTPEQMVSLRWVLRWLGQQAPGARIVGHGEINNTACPGSNLDVAALRADQ